MLKMRAKAAAGLRAGRREEEDEIPVRETWLRNAEVLLLSGLLCR